MSTEEQDAAILRVVRERTETKRKRSLLEGELRSIGRTLSSVGHALQNTGNVPNDAPQVLEKVTKIGDLPNIPKIIQMCRDYAELDQTLKILNARAKEIGID